jgi:hypothetical protein
MYKFAIPLKVLEAGDGALLFMFMVAVAFFGSYIIRALAMTKARTRQKFYRPEIKAGIAFLTIFSGMELAIGTDWWSLHLENRGAHVTWPIFIPLYVIGVLLALWGTICSVRALTGGSWPPFRWFWIAALAVAFGIWFAY